MGSSAELGWMVAIVLILLIQFPDLGSRIKMDLSPELRWMVTMALILLIRLLDYVTIIKMYLFPESASMVDVLTGMVLLVLILIIRFRELGSRIIMGWPPELRRMVLQVLVLIQLTEGLSITSCFMVFIIGTIARRGHFKPLLISIIVAMISVVYDSYKTYIEAAERPAIFAVLFAVRTSINGLLGIGVAILEMTSIQNMIFSSSKLGTSEKDPSLEGDEKTEI